MSRAQATGMTPANAEVGDAIYRIVRALEHLDLAALKEIEAFVAGETDLIDSLQVAVMAWDAETTQDGLREIGLGDDITFPLMPRAITSMAHARAVLHKHRPPRVPA